MQKNSSFLYMQLQKSRIPEIPKFRSLNLGQMHAVKLGTAILQFLQTCKNLDYGISSPIHLNETYWICIAQDLSTTNPIFPSTVEDVELRNHIDKSIKNSKRPGSKQTHELSIFW